LVINKRLNVRNSKLDNVKKGFVRHTLHVSVVLQRNDDGNGEEEQMETNVKKTYLTCTGLNFMY